MEVYMKKDVLSLILNYKKGILTREEITNIVKKETEGEERKSYLQLIDSIQLDTPESSWHGIRYPIEGIPTFMYPLLFNSICDTLTQGIAVDTLIYVLQRDFGFTETLAKYLTEEACIVLSVPA